jgi:hypothetical protein
VRVPVTPFAGVIGMKGDQPIEAMSAQLVLEDLDFGER